MLCSIILISAKAVELLTAYNKKWRLLQMKRYELFIENNVLYLHWMCKEQHYGQSCSCKIIPLIKTSGGTK